MVLPQNGTGAVHLFGDGKARAGQVGINHIHRIRSAPGKTENINRALLACAWAREPIDNEICIDRCVCTCPDKAARQDKAGQRDVLVRDQLPT